MVRGTEWSGRRNRRHEDCAEGGGVGKGILILTREGLEEGAMPLPRNFFRFLPHNAIHKRGRCRHAVSVCVFVCVSVTFVNYVKTNKHIIKICSPSGRNIILVFSTPNGIAIFRWGRPFCIGYSLVRSIHSVRSYLVSVSYFRFAVVLPSHPTFSDF